VLFLDAVLLPELPGGWKICGRNIVNPVRDHGDLLIGDARLPELFDFVPGDCDDP